MNWSSFLQPGHIVYGLPNIEDFLLRLHAVARIWCAVVLFAEPPQTRLLPIRPLGPEARARNGLRRREISGAGGNNNAVTVNVEQLAAWDPDVLILQAPSRPIAELSSLPVCGSLKAVTSKRVYLNPRGVFPWDRYGPEAALQVQWAARILHPELFADLNIRSETRDFYAAFLGYPTTEMDLDTMLMTAP